MNENFLNMAAWEVHNDAQCEIPQRLSMTPPAAVHWDTIVDLFKIEPNNFEMLVKWSGQQDFKMITQLGQGQLQEVAVLD